MLPDRCLAFRYLDVRDADVFVLDLAERVAGIGRADADGREIARLSGLASAAPGSHRGRVARA